MSDLLQIDAEYAHWLKNLKERVRAVQIKAMIKVNSELLHFYWELGADIVRRQSENIWGEGFINQLSLDLMQEFPDMKGFSIRNLKYIKQWYLFYSNEHSIGQQPVAQLDLSANHQIIDKITQIPWGHNIAIITKCKSISDALYYTENTLLHNWSRAVLVHQIESGLYQREGKAVINFNLTLPKPQSDLALQTLKDPYIFDFLSMTKNYNELELTQSLPENLKPSLPSIEELERELSGLGGGDE